MAYAINTTCKKCTQKTVLSITDTMFGKITPIRCKKCDKIYSVAVPKKQVFIDRENKNSKREEPSKTIIGKKKEEEAILKLEVKQSQFSKQQNLNINQKITTIGRKSPSSSADIQIDTTDQHISRVHFIIEKRTNNSFTLADKGSGNGTYLNNEKLDLEEVVYLSDGDIIGIGKTKIEARIF
jgi:pSer/pThr/pTyr-binding forkhead associated (FHA) protein